MNKTTDFNKTKSRISVVVPSYNHAPFVEKCLKSIFNQTHLPDELLIIDDGSNDGSPAIIEKTLKESPIPAKLIVRPNKGLCATLNESFEMTSGDYFAYLGSDDLWLPDFLEARIKLLESRPKAVLAYGHTYIINEDGEIFDCTQNWAESVYLDGDVRPMLYSGYAPFSPSVCYRRAALMKRNWNEDSKLEDYELYLQLCHDGEFAFDERILSVWRSHSSNTGNIPFFLSECLEAQTRCAQVVGWSEKQLKQIQRKLRFRYVEEFVRTGNKSKAWELYFKNLGGASLRMIGRTTLRLLIPQSLIQMRRRKSAGNNLEKYKEVKIF